MYAKVLYFSKFGRRAQRRPTGLIASTLIFSIFSFKIFIFYLRVHHEYTHPMIFIHTNGCPNLSIVLKSHFFIFTRHSLVSNAFLAQFNSQFYKVPKQTIVYSSFNQTCGYFQFHKFDHVTTKISQIGP